MPYVAPESQSAQEKTTEALHTQKVLQNPIIGETVVWSGSEVPPMWMPTKGQPLKVADYRMLFRVLGKSAGGDGKQTFKLPNIKYTSRIIAVAGTYPGTRGAVQAILAERRKV